jgi:periplasmic protein TonB
VQQANRRAAIEKSPLAQWRANCIRDGVPTAKSQTLSLGLHAAFVALLLLVASQQVRQTPPDFPVPPTRLSRLILPRPAQQRAGGSNRTELPAKRGTPPPTTRRTFIPPISQPHPQLPMPITAFDTSEIAINSAEIGDPFSRMIDGGLGLHGINGIGGRGCCQGIGESPKGTLGIGVARGRDVTPPQLIFKVEPEFSEEARKAKYQGVVVLAIQVDTSGQVRNPRIIQPLGLGLDERAIEAVSKWRFRPGVRNGKPVVTEATVQVTFQLL